MKEAATDWTANKAAKSNASKASMLPASQDLRTPMAREAAAGRLRKAAQGTLDLRMPRELLLVISCVACRGLICISCFLAPAAR